MKENNELILNIKKILESNKYKIISGKIPKGFSFNPDIFAKKRKGFTAFLVRKSDKIPEGFIQRVSTTKISKNELQIYFIFDKKPGEIIVKKSALYGIGIKYFSKNRIYTIEKSKSFSRIRKIKPKRKKKKMSQQDVFISSDQSIEERRIAETVIDELREVNRWSLFPIKVEDDPRFRNMDDLDNCIDENLRDCEIFLGILAERYRPRVKKEFKAALDIFRTEDILIFIKFLKKRPKELVKLIEFVKVRNIKYFEYVDSIDFRKKLMRTLTQKIKKVHEEEGVPFMK